MSDADAIIVARIINSFVLLVGTFVAWRIGRGQVMASSISTNRHTWMAQFREEIASLITANTKFIIFSNSYDSEDKEQTKILAELNRQMSLPYYRLKLLIGEKGENYQSFLIILEQFLKSIKTPKELMESAVVILRKELDHVETGK